MLWGESVKLAKSTWLFNPERTETMTKTPQIKQLEWEHSPFHNGDEWGADPSPTSSNTPS